MAMALAVEEPNYEDATIELQIQQFFDEWHYRVLHSGLAYEMDRTEVINKALELFVMAGMPLTELEMEEIADMEDEEEMISILVSKMPKQMKTTFEHFSLQLQLVVSAATRVRHALEESSPEEIARVMDDGDAGIGQQVLKQAVIEAGVEISTLVKLQSDWGTSMDTRVKRLAGCANEAAQLKSQYEAIVSQTATFGDAQNDKAKGVLGTMAASSHKTFMMSVFRGWLGSHLRDKMEGSIHQSFRRQIEDANLKLVNYQKAQFKNTREVLQRKARGVDNVTMVYALRAWSKVAEDNKDGEALAEKNEQMRNKLLQYKQSSQDNTKRVMTRMAGDNDEQLLSMVFQALVTYVIEYQKNKELEDQVKEAEQRIAQFTEEKSSEAKKVLHRMLASTENGLIVFVMTSWVTSFKEEKKHREFQNGLNAAEHKFSMLSGRQKKAARNMADRTNKIDEENFITMVFTHWHLEVKMDKVYNHYSTKMEQKKNQLQEVRSMFQTFATQLEQTTGNSPRSNAKHGGKKKDKDS
jgi:uncharacterized protein YifE (UPF0438 family)|eukprot:TRINITY_DN43275_c0_g1_i1.p1 TRINITY_DN43275_c0_g1~~TRINITY_DN43275_c0_g1_i1.p1  ORF type:complete len:524 (+),score=114.58 TRINITY_DN43275_c0_g1_i1:86-1657(+)